jgi:hypothetical protein
LLKKQGIYSRKPALIALPLQNSRLCLGYGWNRAVHLSCEAAKTPLQMQTDPLSNPDISRREHYPTQMLAGEFGEITGDRRGVPQGLW